MNEAPLHPSIVALASLAANIAANHPRQGLCQVDRLKSMGVSQAHIDAVVEIARHIRDESGETLDSSFDQAMAGAVPAPPQPQPQPWAKRAARRPPRGNRAADFQFLEISMSTHIKVLGTGCANCKTTLKLIGEVAAEKGAKVELEKVEDIQAIMGYGVMSTPGVVIDGKVVHAGGVPSRDKIAGWLAGSDVQQAASQSGGCCSGGKCC